jgi:hypothetical protein
VRSGSGFWFPHTARPARRGDVRDRFRGETPVRAGHRPLAVVEHGSGVELAEALDQPGDTFTEGVSMAAQMICRSLGVGRFPQVWTISDPKTERLDPAAV